MTSASWIGRPILRRPAPATGAGIRSWRVSPQLRDREIERPDTSVEVTVPYPLRRFVRSALTVP